MSEALAYAGALLLLVATLPQAVRLLRTRRADDLAWSFVLLNAAGIALLALRSQEIGETAFLALNVGTALFWLLAALVKRWPSATPAGTPADAEDLARPKPGG